MFSKSIRTAALLGFALFIAGCGSGSKTSAKLTGKVTLDGTPIQIGTVIAYSEDGSVAGSGGITGEGTYTIMDAPIGKVKLAIVVPADNEQPAAPPAAKQQPAKDTKKPNENMESYLTSVKGLPPHYRRADTSGLITEVKQGTNEFDIGLSKKKRA